MEVLDCMRTRVAVRSFRSEAVPQHILLKVLEAGRWAPSSKNSQPWHFIVVRDPKTLRRLASPTPTGPHLAQAPAAICVVTIGAKMPYVDGARVVQNMVLAAWGLGLGTCWIANFDEERVKELLGLPRESILITVFPIGYPEPSVLRVRKRRKPLEEIVHWERFGNRRPPGGDESI